MMNNLRITTRIYLSLAACIILVLVLGLASWFYISSLWDNTKSLYDHPFVVQKAIGDLQSDALSIRLEMKDLIDETDDAKIQEQLQKIASLDSDAEKKFDILYERYLGPKDDIDQAWQAFVTYRTIRSETIRLFQAGDLAEAIKRSNNVGAGGIQIAIIMDDLAIINNYAQSKGDEFYAKALAQKNQTAQHLVLLLAVLLALGLIIGYFLVRAIKEPLIALIDAINAFKQGRLESRSDYRALNEFGQLSSAFNTMAESIETRMLTRQNAASLSNALLYEIKLQSFAARLLSTLTTLTGAQMGAVYLLNASKTAYDCLDSIGLADASRESFSALNLEGELGLAAATKTIQHITDIDPSTRLTFETVYDRHKAKEIITIPLFKEEEVFALLSIASIRPFKSLSLELVNDIWKELNARLAAILAANQIADYAQKLERINTELDAQAKEVAMQRDELSEQNIELEMQKKLLDEASQLKSSFLSNMSHELRTPLNSVIALASVLNRRLADKIPEEEYSYIEVIERNGKHLLALVNDILDLARIESGKEQVNLSRFTVYQLVNEVVDMIEPQALEKKIGLLNKADRDLPEMRSDLAKCRHILINIISNAVKFTDAGEVSVRAVRVGREILISVKDTGIGIPEDKLDYIFDEFRQGDETPSRQNGGTGLGLAIARKYASLIGGSIEVESTLGVGSLFTLRLPIEMESAITDLEEYFEDRLIQKQSHADAGRDSKLKSILLVEDSEPAIIQMRDILTETGYQIRVARNGKEALDQIELAMPDAMILDLMMPEIDGFQVLGAIRSVPKTADIPVLILSAKHVSKEELSFLKGNHISQLIQKGAISKKDLLSAVDNMVFRGVPAARQPKEQNSSVKPTILVVEDNPDNLMTVKALLHETYQIIEATDGQAGIDEALKNAPSLILLDISLPKIDGFQVLDALKKDDKTAGIPIVALTARVMTGDREAILKYGFDDYISKPIDEALLKMTIRSFLYGK